MAYALKWAITFCVIYKTLHEVVSYSLPLSIAVDETDILGMA